MEIYASTLNRIVRISKIHLLILLVLVAVLLIWHGTHRYQSYRTHLHLLVQQSINGAASELSEAVSRLLYTASIFSKEHHDLINYLARYPDSQPHVERLEEYTGDRFPNYFAVTIADDQGELLLGNFDLLINEICQKAIQEFITNKFSYELFIHPHVDAYHIDIITTWKQDQYKSRPGVLFFSIKPDTFVRILKNSELLGHRLVLLKDDVDGLVEISSDGSRIETYQSDTDGFYISKRETELIQNSKHIKGTRWNLVDIPDADYLSEELIKIIIQLSVVYFSVCIGALLLFYAIQRGQKHKLTSEKQLFSLRQQLNRILDFTGVGLWEFNVNSKTFQWCSNSFQILHGELPTTINEYQQLVLPEYRDQVRSFIAKCKRSHSSHYFEHRVSLPDEKIRWITLTGVLLANQDGQDNSVAGLIQDVTDRKISEQKYFEFELRQKDTLIREVHHRIKNNLQGVINLLYQYLQEGAVENAFIEQIIGQLYSVSLIHGINGNTLSGRFDVIALINKICASAFTIKGINNKKYEIPEHEIIIKMDNSRAVAIALIINELVNNALKHTPDQELSNIRVSVVNLNTGILFKISNNGYPLPKEFDFEKGYGLGTGLNLIKSLLPKPGAKITILQQEKKIVSQFLLTEFILEECNAIESDTA